MTMFGGKLAALVLDATTVTVVRADQSAEPTLLAWTPDAPGRLAEALRALTPAPAGFVVVVGLGLLDIAEPELPKLDRAARRALLWRDVDRYFPIEGVAAVSLDERFAFAAPAQLFDSWIGAVESIAPVRVVLAAPRIVARFIGEGDAVLAAGASERGLVVATQGRIVDVRRSASEASHTRASHATTVVMDAAAIGREALAWADAPVDDQLLHAAQTAVFARRARQRWIGSVAMAALAILALVWSADRARSSALATLRARAESLAAEAGPAERALTRLAGARAEIDLLREADMRSASPDAPLRVLAELGRVLPRDAFVQRLEWTGSTWRLEGTADNAPRLVPLLDGDARFRDVRIVSPSQRFLDVGRIRESFAISFRMRGETGAANGAP